MSTATAASSERMSTKGSSAGGRVEAQADKARRRIESLKHATARARRAADPAEVRVRRRAIDLQLGRDVVGEPLQGAALDRLADEGLDGHDQPLVGRAH